MSLPSTEILTKIEEEFLKVSTDKLENSLYPEFIHVFSPFNYFIKLLFDNLIDRLYLNKKRDDTLYVFIGTNSESLPAEHIFKGLKILRNTFLELFIDIIEDRPENTHMAILSFFDELEIEVISNSVKSLCRIKDEEFLKRMLGVHKKAVIGKLSGYIAHEFNNILTVVKNWAQLGLIEEGEDIRRKAFDGIVKSSNRASLLTRSILNFYRRMNSGNTTIKLYELIELLLVGIDKKLTKEGIVIEKSYGDVSEFSGDKFRLEEAIFNILINACDSLKGEEKKITIITCEKDGYAEVIISDTGEGISEENQKKMFDPFFTTRNTDEGEYLFSTGIGLGLTIAYDIIKSHGGNIKVESACGRGSDFKVYLPLMK